MLSFFPRGVLDEILNLIESVSEGFPSYFCMSDDLKLGKGCFVFIIKLFSVECYAMNCCCICDSCHTGFMQMLPL